MLVGQSLHTTAPEIFRALVEATAFGALTIIRRFEEYGVKVDRKLHEEVLERYGKLGIQPYSGFVNPIYTPVMEGGEIVDIIYEYPKSYTEQMLDYSSRYSFLPSVN